MMSTMMKSSDSLNDMAQFRYPAGVLYLALSTMFVAMQFLLFIKGSAIVPLMDFTGWLFYLTSCLSHAATLTVIPFLLFYMPLAACHHHKIGGGLMVSTISLVSVLVFLDMQVYDIYRFHINGFVLNMLFSSGATDIFTFDTQLYVKECSLFAVLVLVQIALWLLAQRWVPRCSRHLAWKVFGVLVGVTLYAHGYHIYASFVQQPSVMKSRRLLPYYFPTTAYGLMTNLGFEAPVSDGTSALGSIEGDVSYPLRPIASDTSVDHPNIVLILIDSWNPRALTAECMPTVWQYAQDNSWYQNHFSCSNGTRSSVFGLFFSVPSYYWDVFESSHVSPVFIDEMQKMGYRCQVYPSATLHNPPFNRVVFHHIKDLHVQTEGNTVFERDRKLTDNFLSELPGRVASGRPFFSMLFYDLAHSFELPKEHNTRFQPAWDFADYANLENSTDPTFLFNLYRNCCYQIDQQVKRVLSALEDAGLSDNTIVMITGDHGQEFNENRKNYWIHGSNFSRWQLGVPLIVHYAGKDPTPARFTYRTTHYDIVPTLMREALGVTNDIADYSVGHLLNDSSSRSWHVVGSELNYAFIVGGDSILEKTADGSLEVTDGKMNPVVGYKLNATEFNQAVDRLNRYMKK